MNNASSDIYKKFKPKELKVFGTPEWLAESRKKYRSVFDQSETTYIYAEFSFYNKLFDEEDWEASITLRAYYASFPENTRKVCEIERKELISKNENIFYIREGWGNDNPGQFWTPGVYYWEALIDNVQVLQKYFYVENYGRVTPENNPYFNILSVKMFESPDFPVALNERIYLKKFKDTGTRYVWLELEIQNLQTEAPWFGEFFFNFYNDIGQLKGQVIELKSISTSPDNPNFLIEVGWGSNIMGSWFKDKYTVQIVFMDQLIAVIPFEVGGEFEEGEVQFTQPSKDTDYKPVKKVKELSNDEIFKEIESLIGLTEIKHRLKEYVSYLNFIKLRTEKGFHDIQKINLHAVFTGNPGTGKTTVAKLLGKIYQSLGLLSTGTVLQVDRTDLVAKFIGQTAPKVKEVIEKARGGILFIDEAYALVRSETDSQDFGHEAIEVLVKELSEGQGDLAIIVAGYPKEMKTFINSNPGLKSRFNLWYNFPDYLPQELMLISDYSCSKRSVMLSPEARETLYKQIVEDFRNRDSAFGNARYINSIIDEAKMNLGLRIMNSQNPAQLSSEELSTIIPDDINCIFNSGRLDSPDIPIVEELLQEAVLEINELIGITNIKNEINELIKLVRFYRETRKDVLNRFSLHTVFTGNPGTGKTTVARILAKIYKALGLLERGHLIECDREALIAGYIGQTAIKTAQVIDKAIGGVLFIDEAYALTMFSGGHSDFGFEAIEVILKRMEDKQNRFAVVVAGYPNEMNEFLESNPGLRSRFDKILRFEDYSCDELMKIAVKMFQKEHIQPEESALGHLQVYFDYLSKNRDKFFGNARVVKKVVAECIKNQNLRLASIPAKDRTEDMIHNLLLSDVEEFKPSTDQIISQRQKKIGFSLE